MRKLFSSDEALKEKEAAKYLRLSCRTLQAWRLKDLGPNFIRISLRAVRYRKSDLDKWLEQKRSDRRNNMTDEHDPIDVQIKEATSALVASIAGRLLAHPETATVEEIKMLAASCLTQREAK